MRIVSLLSSATEMLFALGLGDDVLAVSHECDWPPDAQSRPRATRSRIDSNAPSNVIDAQVKQLLAVGEPLYEIDGDLLRELQPDVIVTQSQCDVCAIRLEDVLSLKHAAPELAHTHVVHLNPQTLEDVLADVRRIAEYLDCSSQANSLLIDCEQRIAAVRERAAELAEESRPRVLCIEWIEPLMPAGNWTPQLIELAGGRSGLATAGEHSRYATWAEVASFDPEVILVSPCGFDLQRTLREARGLFAVPGWTQLAAVRRGQVYAIDGNALLNRSGPRLIESLEVLAQILQPAMFPDRHHTEYWQRLQAG